MKLTQKCETQTDWARDTATEPKTAMWVFKASYILHHSAYSGKLSEHFF